MNLVNEVSYVLEDNFVSHGHLVLDSSHHGDHHIVTDHERVFVKVMKNNDEPAVAYRLQNEVNFAVNTEYGTVPLLEHVNHRTSNDYPFILSAWEWENRTPVGMMLNPIQAAKAALELAEIHSSRHYKQLETDSKEEFLEYGQKFSSHSFNYLEPPVQNRLKEVFTELIKPGTDLLALNPAMNVVSHGKAIPEKFMLRNPDGKLFWSNYQYARSAPREYDLAFLYLSLVHRMNRPDMWEVVTRDYERATGHSVNTDKLNQLLNMLLGRTALEVASKTLHATDKEKLERFLNQLEPLLQGKPATEVRSLALIR